MGKGAPQPRIGVGLPLEWSASVLWSLERSDCSGWGSGLGISKWESIGTVLVLVMS